MIVKLIKAIILIILSFNILHTVSRENKIEKNELIAWQLALLISVLGN